MYSSNGTVCRAALREGQGQIAPGPQAPRGLITPNASRSVGLHKVNTQFFSKVNF